MNRRLLPYFLVLLIPASLWATETYVNQDNTGDITGSTPERGYLTIADGISNINGSDAYPDTLYIVGSDSAYEVSMILSINLTFVGISNNQTGQDSVFLTAVDSTVFEIPTLSSELNDPIEASWHNLVFQDSYRAIDAVIEFYPDMSLRFVDCTFQRTNTNANIGGIRINAVDEALIEIDNCTFSNLHSSSLSSAIDIRGGKRVSITNSVFLNDTTTSKEGGAVGIMDADEIRISSSTFQNNSATNNNGGALYIQPDNVAEVWNSEFFNNSAPLSSGGGIYTSASSNLDSVHIHHSKFIGNTASLGGAFGMEDRGSPFIQNNTFYNNNATNNGFDIFISNILRPHIIRNNIFAGQDAQVTETRKYIYIDTKSYSPTMDVSYNRFPSDGWAVEGDYNSSITGNVSSDPQFTDTSPADPAQIDLHLSGNSYLINRGAIKTGTFGEYRTEPEPNGDRVNMGRYGNTSEASVANSIELTHVSSPLVPQNDTLQPSDAYVEAIEDSNWWYHIEVNTGDSDTIVNEPSFYFDSLATNRGGVGWVPENEHVGQHNVSFSISDGPSSLNRTASTGMNIRVSNRNDTVRFVFVPNDTSVAEDSTIVLQFQTYDPDTLWGDTPDFYVQHHRDSLYLTTLDQATGQLTWTPGNADVGVNGINVIAVDDSGATDTAQVNITVTNTQPQLAAQGDTTVTEADSVVIDLEEETEDEGSKAGAYYYLVDGPSWLDFPSNADSSAGIMRGIPRNKDVTLTLSDTIIAEFTDGNGGTSRDTFLVSVQNKNNPPDSTGVPNWTSLLEDTTYVGYFTFNDSDLVHPGEDSLAFELDYDYSLDIILDKVGEDSARVTWTPRNDEVGNRELAVIARDEAGDTARASVRVTVENQPPVLADSISWEVYQGNKDTLDLNASDEGAAALGYQFTNAPDIDTSMSLAQYTGEIIYNPANAEVGEHYLDIEFNDGQAPDSVVSSVLVVSVINANDPPQITSVDTGSVDEDSMFTYQITAIDPDSAYGDSTTTFSLADTLLHMSLSGDSILWRPYNGDVGENVIRIYATDDSSATDTLDLTVTVRNTNDPPQFITAVSDTSISEDSTFTLTVVANDSDLVHGGETLTFETPQFTIDSLHYTAETFSLIKNTDSAAVFSWTPPNKNVGTWNVLIPLRDGASAVDTFRTQVTVANAISEQIAIPDTTIGEDTLWTYDLAYSDEDTADGWWKAFYTIGIGTQFSDISWISVDSASGVITANPDQAQVDSSGLSPIPVHAHFKDGNGGGRDTSFAITVNNRNDAPEFSTDTVVVQIEEGQRWQASNAATDQEGQVLTYTDTLYSSTSGNDPDDLQFNPGAQTKFDWLIPRGEGYDGTYYIGLYAEDPVGAYDSLVYELKVVDASDPPEITQFADTLYATQGQDNSYTFLATDLDFTSQDGDAISWSILSSGDLSGYLSIAAQNDSGSVAELQWDMPPINDVVGTHQVFIRLSDQRSFSEDTDSSFVMVVRNINDAPVVTGIQDSVIQGIEGQRLEYPFTLREIDRGDSVTFSFEPSEFSGRLEVIQTPIGDDEAPDSSVALVWQSPPDKFTLYNFLTMYATDDSGAVDTVEFQIYIKNVNSKPTYVTSQSRISSATQDQIYYQQLEANDPDASDSNTDITWIIDSTSTNTPFHFVLNDVAMDTVTGQTALLQWDRPHNSDTHPDTVRGVQVLIQDTAGAFNKKWYTVPVQNVNDAPSFIQIDSQEATEGQSWSIDVESYLIEPDSAHGDFSTYQFSQSQPPPDGMSIDPNTGVISWTPTNQHTLGSSNHHIYFKAIDQSGASGTGDFIIHVNNVNSPPVFITRSGELPDTAIVNGQYVAEIQATDPDPTNDIVTFFGGTNNPDTVKVVRNDNGTDTSSATVSWTPAPEQAGNHTLRLRVRDNHGVYADSTFAWDVTVIDTVNRAPSLVNFDPDTAATQGKIYQAQFRATDLNPGDADNFIWSLPSKPANMNINASTGLLTWNSPTNQSVVESPVSVTVRVTDAGGLFDQQTYLITVNNINDPPEITSEAVTEAKEDTLYTYEIRAKDIDKETEDSDSLRYHLQMNPNLGWLQFDAEINMLYGTPEQPDTQRTEVTVTVTDDSGATAQQVFTLQFRNANDTPKIVSPQVFPGFAQNVLDSVQVTASDTDAVFFYDSVSFAIGNLPENFVSLGDTSWFRQIDNLSAMFYWRPNNDYVPDTTLTIVATDTSGASQSIPYQVTVDNRNDPPIFTSPDSDTLTEDQLWTYAIASIDPDTVVGDTGVVYSLIQAFDGMTLTGEQIRWTPDNTSVGDTLLRVVAKDDSSAGDTLDLALHIRNANNPPETVSLGDTSAIEDQLFTRTIPFIEPDSAFGDVVTFRLDVAPDGMEVDEQTGEITWTPVNEQVPDSHKVKYTLTDTSQAFATDSFYIAVQNVNDPPIHTGNPSLTVTEGESWDYQRMLVDDPDVAIGLDTLRYFGLQIPAGMTIDPDSGFIDWIPSDDDLDEDGSNISFTLGAVDTGDDSVLIPLTVTMLNRPTPPRFLNLRDTTIAQSDTFRYTVLAEDTDPDGNIVSYEMISAPSPFTGEFIPTTGELTWMPVNANVGSDTLVFEAIDDDDSLAVDTLYIYVKNSNDPPVFAGETDTIAYEDSLYQQTFIAEDPDKDVGAAVHLTYTLQHAPRWMNLSTVSSTDSMKLTGQPLNRHVGYDSVVVAVYDDSSYSYLRFLLHTENTNDNPVIKSVVLNANKTVAEGDRWQYQFVAKDVDLIHSSDEDSLWLVGVDTPGEMALDSSLQRVGLDSVTGQIEWTPGNDAAIQGAVPITIGVQDQSGAQVNQSFTLAVENTNNTPYFGADTLFITAVERDSLIIPLEITEPDTFVGDRVNFSTVSGAPAGMFFTNTTEDYSELHWYPENQHVTQKYYVKVTGDDQSGETDTLICHITVENRNTAPVLRNTIPELTLYEDSLWTDTLIVHDSDVDIQRDTVRFALENAPAGLTISPEYLSTANDSVFVISWEPNNSQVVADSQFTVRFTDDSAATASQTVLYSVLNTNDPPIFVRESLSMTIKEDTLFSHKFDVTDDDSSYGESLTFRYKDKSVIPDLLMLDSGDGLLSWIPVNAQAEQTYKFDVIVNDTSRLEDTLNVSLQVNNVNDAPVFTFPAKDTMLVIPQDSLWQIRYVLTDEDTLFGDVASIGNMPNPPGVEVIPEDSLIRWRPDSSDVGLHTININAIDTGSLEDTLRFYVRVDDINDWPIITSPAPGTAFTVKQDSLLRFTVSAQDADTVYGTDYLRFDWDSTTLAFTENLPVIDSITGEIEWTPVNAQYGEHQFTAIVRDSSGLADSVTFSITVIDQNDAPYFVSVQDTLYFTEDADSIHRALIGYDPDLYHMPDTTLHDSILFDITSLASHGTDGLTITTVEDTVGVLEWIPTNEQVGTYEIQISVHDTSVIFFTDTTLTLIVLNKNNAPVIAAGDFPPSLVFEEDSDLSIDLSQYVTDADKQTGPGDISWYISHVDTARQQVSRQALLREAGGKRTGKSAGITHLVENDGTVHIDTSALPVVRFYADTNYFTTDSVQFRFIASDPEAFSDTLERGVWVTSVNDKPVISDLPDSVTNEDTALHIDVRGWNNFISDVETDTADMNWIMVTAGSHFTRENTGSRYTVVPDTNWFGEDSVLIIVTDESAASDSAWWHITVNSVNDAPYFVRSPGDTVFIEDDSVTIALNQFVEDIDHTHAELAWQFSMNESPESVIAANTTNSRQRMPANKVQVNTHSESQDKVKQSVRVTSAVDSTFMLGNYIFRYKAGQQTVTIRGTQDFYHEDQQQFWYKVIDPFGAPDSASAGISIMKENDPPVLRKPPPLTFSEDDSITIQLDSLVTDVDDIADSLRWYITLDSLQQPDYAALDQSRSYFERISATDTLYAYHMAPEPFLNGAGERIAVYTSQDYFNDPGRPVRVFLGVVDTSGNRDIQSTLLSVEAVNDPPIREHALREIALSQTYLREESQLVVVGLDSVFRDVDDPYQSLRWHIAVDSTEISAIRYDSVDVTLVNDSLTVNLRLTPTWNYAGEETYVISVTDTSNSTAFDTLHFSVLDTIAPIVDVGVIQHPLITSAVDLYFFFSEEVTHSPRPKLWIQQPNQRDSVLVQARDFIELPWAEHMNPPYPYYHQFRINDPGVVNLYLRDIIDVDNPEMLGDRQFQFGADSIPAMAKAVVSSPRGTATLSIPAKGTDKSGYWLGYEPDLTQQDNGLGKRPGPGNFRLIDSDQVANVVHFEGPVSHFRKKARIGFLVDPKADTWQHASIVHWNGERWKLLQTYFTSKNEQIWAYTGSPGTYGILWESGVPVQVLPEEYNLAQNYPNPFNPTTMIEYALPDVLNDRNGMQIVRLDIYNILGLRVRTLVNKAQKPGMYQVRWDGTNSHGTQMASGIYFYRLQAGKFVKANKMVLIR